MAPGVTAVPGLLRPPAGGTAGQPTRSPVVNSFICKAKVFSRGSVAVSYVFASRCGLRVIRAVVSALCAEAGRSR